MLIDAPTERQKPTGIVDGWLTHSTRRAGPPSLTAAPARLRSPGFIGGALAPGVRVEVEGRISALDTSARTVVLRGVTVSHAGNVSYVVGSAADLALNRQVVVKGHLAADRSHVDATSIHIEL